MVVTRLREEIRETVLRIDEIALAFRGFALASHSRKEEVSELVFETAMQRSASNSKKKSVSSGAADLLRTDRPLTMQEKTYVLAAVHDWCCTGAGMYQPQHQPLSRQSHRHAQ